MIIRLAVVVLCTLVLVAQAVSVGRDRPLSYLSSVRGLTVSGDGVDQKVTVGVEIPSTRRYHNIARRWWAVADPNNSGFLGKFGFSRDSSITEIFNEAQTPFGVSSETLFSYLTRNSSVLESPQSTQHYKFVLEPNPVASVGHTVWTLNDKGEEVPHPDFPGSSNVVTTFKGTAYRRVAAYRVADGKLQYKYKPVGWARITIHDIGSDNPRVRGSWKVDDEEGLGVPAAIYHINDVHSFKLDLRDDEWSLLDGLESDMVVWRDLDMRTSQYNDYEILDDDYRPLLDDPHIRKRETTTPEFDLQDTNILPEYYERIAGDAGTLFRRSGQDDDTGDSGFSSGINLKSTIGDTDGCPERKKIALIGMAADCNYMNDFNSTSDVREHFINTVNQASEQYEKSFNITLGLASIFMPKEGDCPSTSEKGDDKLEWNYKCGSDDTENGIGDRLNKFSVWRGSGNRTYDNHATWSLFTSCKQGSVVGLSWLGMICNSKPSDNGNGTSVSGANVISKTQLDWRVFAHELGHSFGAVHDCTDSTCSSGKDRTSDCCPKSKDDCDASGKYIMNPSSTDSQDGFSDCTQGNVCQAMKRNSVNSTCLTSNTGVKLVTKNECGNGIVEDGEDCDCGGEEGCKDNDCCDPKTCKFKDDADCDDANDVCCNNCKFSSSDTVCRKSQGPCDPEEKCTGKSAACPEDKHKPDGEECKDKDSGFDDLVCISGHCTSRDRQCVQLLANTTIKVNGDEVNITKACSNDDSCQLSCVDPSYRNMCIRGTQNFLDGTPCQGKGHCQRGKCVNGSHTNPLNSNGDGPFSPSWFERHKAAVIGVVCGIAALIVILIVNRMYQTHVHSSTNHCSIQIKNGCFCCCSTTTASTTIIKPICINYNLKQHLVPTPTSTTSTAIPSMGCPSFLLRNAKYQPQ
jgi:hypothetical protein